MSSNAATEPNAYFEARTKSGEIFGPSRIRPELSRLPRLLEIIKRMK